MKLSYHDWLDQVLYVTKTKHDKDVTDHIRTIYVENETKLSWSIRRGVINYENQIGQRCDQ